MNMYGSAFICDFFKIPGQQFFCGDRATKQFLSTNGTRGKNNKKGQSF
jgi:hypothetical protein